jgi:hypothetical protein
LKEAVIFPTLENTGFKPVIGITDIINSVKGYKNISRLPDPLWEKKVMVYEPSPEDKLKKFAG